MPIPPNVVEQWKILANDAVDAAAKAKSEQERELLLKTAKHYEELIQQYERRKNSSGERQS
jgi:hypothetical protein